MNYDNFKLSLGNMTTNFMTLSICMQLESNWKITSEDFLIEISYNSYDIKYKIINHKNLMMLSISMHLESNCKLTSKDLLIEISYDEIFHDWLR